jgi:hypothetical protein
MIPSVTGRSASHPGAGVFGCLEQPGDDTGFVDAELAGSLVQRQRCLLPRRMPERTIRRHSTCIESMLRRAAVRSAA